MSDIKFNIKVHTYGKGSDYYDMTEEEINNKCCIYGGFLYFYDTIPDDEKCDVDVGYARLTDIYCYECTAWWYWPDEHKSIMEIRVEERKQLVRDGKVYR